MLTRSWIPTDVSDAIAACGEQSLDDEGTNLNPNETLRIVLELLKRYGEAGRRKVSPRRALFLRQCE
jgi:hypothetical protein